MPIIKKRVSDPIEYVRAAIATVICDFAPILGQQNARNFLVPLLTELIKDESSEVNYVSILLSYLFVVHAV